MLYAHHNCHTILLLHFNIPSYVDESIDAFYPVSLILSLNPYHISNFNPKPHPIYIFHFTPSYVGTNVEEAKKLIEASGFKMIVTDDLEDAANKAVKVADIVRQAEEVALEVQFH